MEEATNNWSHEGSGCGTVGRVVTSHTGDLWFDYLEV